MTKHEESVLGTIKKQVVVGVVGLCFLAIGGLTSFYYTTKATVNQQSEEIKELKKSVKSADPEQIGRIKYRMQKIEDKMEEVQVQVNSAIRVMESFKADQERKTDRMLELLIEIKRNQ